MLTLQALLWKALAEKGHFVCTTRARDEFVALQSRAAYANAMNVDAFISLHANASTHEAVRGAWTIYAAPSDQGKALATQIQKQLAAVAPPSKVGSVFPDGSPWVGNRKLTVLRKTWAPAVMVEAGFMTNIEDQRLLESEVYMETLAGAITKGVEIWNG